VESAEGEAYPAIPQYRNPVPHGRRNIPGAGDVAAVRVDLCRKGDILYFG